MSDTIDKLIFSLAGDLKDLNTAYAQAEAGAQKTGTVISKNIGSGFKEAAAQAATHTTQLKQALGETEQAVNKTHGSVAQATREFRALFDELSSGRTRQTPGTLAIIATRVFGISGATLAWGAALAAIPAGLAYAAVQAENMAARVQRTLEATGYAAGVTRDQILGIGNALDQTTKLSQRGGMDIATILAGRGNVGFAQLQSATKAAFGLSIASGTNEDKAAEELEKILSDPAKGAAELDAQFKLLDVAQVEQIKNLQASGDTAKAQQIIIDALNDRFGKLEESSWSLARAFDSTGKFFSDFWNHTGQMLTGTGKTKQEQLSALETQYAAAQAAAQAIKAGTFEGAGGGANRVYAALKDLPPQIAALKSAIADDTAKTKAGELRTRANSAIGAGLADAEREAGTFQKKLQDLDNELGRDQLAVRLATETHSKYTDELTRQRDAVKLARDSVKLYGDPAVEAATRATEQQRINAASSETRAKVTAEIEAARHLRANLQNPQTALTARTTYAEEMATADAPDRLNRKAESEAERQEKNLEAMKTRAAAARALADAYGISIAAAEKQNAIGEVDVAISEKQIAEKDRLAAENYKLAESYAKAASAVSKEIDELSQSNADLAKELAAGGNPLALAAAKRQMDLDKATQNLSPEDAARLRPQLMQQYETRDQRVGQIGISNDLYTANQGYGRLQQTYGAIRGGATDDDLRHLQVAQKTFDDLVEQHIDPTADANKALADQLLRVKEQTSDLTDAMDKLKQEANEFASDISGPIKQYLTHGGNPMDVPANIGQNMLDTAVQKHLIDPLQKQLESLFGNVLGGDNAPDGSAASPFWVQIMPGSGALASTGIGGNGPLSAGGPLDSLLGDLGIGNFGINPVTVTPGLDISQLGTAGATAGMADSGGLLSSIGDFLMTALSFAGLFDDGGTIGPGQWGIKSGMPEIIQGGTSGVSILPLSAPSITSALGTGAQPGSASGYFGGGAIPNVRGGDTFHFHLPGVKDTQTFLQSRSQLESMVSAAAARGRRNQ